jgi:hypothetical protein
MFDTLLLALFIAIGACAVIRLGMVQSVSFSDYKSSILTMSIIIPIFEEAFFRGILKQALVDVPYNYQINAVLFGLMHCVNYAITKNVYLTVYNVIATGYLGYYLVQLDGFMYAYLTHALYNFSAVTVLYIYYHFYGTKNYCEGYLAQCGTPKIFFCNSETRDDSSIGSRFDIVPRMRFIKRTNIPEDMQKRIDKLRDIEFERPQLFAKSDIGTTAGSTLSSNL